MSNQDKQKGNSEKFHWKKKKTRRAIGGGEVLFYGNSRSKKNALNRKRFGDPRGNTDSAVVICISVCNANLETIHKHFSGCFFFYFQA